MTHDELRDYIDKFDAAGMVREPAVEALRAVVELHKPIDARISLDNYDYIGCDSCTEWTQEGNSHLEYPCPTIQAIEKALA